MALRWYWRLDVSSQFDRDFQDRSGGISQGVRERWGGAPSGEEIEGPNQRVAFPSFVSSAALLLPQPTRYMQSYDDFKLCRAAQEAKQL